VTPGSLPPGRARTTAVRAACVACALLAVTARPPSATAKPGPARLGVRAADTLLVGHPARAKDLEKWAQGAELADLIWLLRRTSGELGASEAVLAAAALARTPSERNALRVRLAARVGAEGRSHRSGGRTIPPPPVSLLPRPRASVFRVGALLPETGDYAEYARAVGFGIEAGLGSVPLPGDRPIEFGFWGTGDENPAKLAESLEAASWRSGVLVGELLSVTTLAVATGARIAGLPLLSPTATDEAVGTVSPYVFQVGPSGWRRGERLARLLIDRPGLRVGTLTSGAPEKSAMARGFLATAESLGAVAEWRSGYSSGTAFREEVRTLQAHRLDVLLWEGEPREAEALLREMSRQKVALRLCGGEGLLPDRLHAESRLLLEGVHIVAEDWRLPEPERARLDSALAVRSADPANELHVRGWLAGRAIARAVAEGALCPEELVANLAARTYAVPWLREHRFLDVERDGITLPVRVVQRGRAVEVVGPAR